MLTIQKEFPRGDIYPVQKLTKGLTPVLFDIETTGLGADTSYLYLIGAMMIKNDRMIFMQWFANSMSEEADLINSFFSWLPDKTCLIHFNGRGFDVPYLSKKCKKLNIPCLLPQMPNIDLYRSFAPIKEYFNMTSRKLVAYEKLIGHNREDVFNGGELINVYRDYVGKIKFNKEEAKKLEEILLLHNEEDILDMVPVLSLFTYMDVFAGNVDNYDCKYVEPEKAETDGHINDLLITIKSASKFPVEYSKKLAIAPDIEPIQIITKDDTASIRIPIYKLKLKHYYQDYKNYYYLPNEDMAVHKNVADGVSKEYREQATKATAYTYTETDFIPHPGKHIEPSFQKDIKDTYSFVPAKLSSKKDFIIALLKSIFSVYCK